ncbi:MAG: hypothetical protein ACXWQ6_02855 [Candidatus Limnocylindrales bacterium]
MTSAPPQQEQPAWSPPGANAQSLSLDLAGATRSEIRLDIAWGRVTLGAASPGKLLEGTFDPPVTVQGGPDKVRLAIEAPWVNWLNWADWRLGLSTEIPIRLVVASAISSLDLDLTEVKLAELELKDAVGRTLVRLPRAAGLTRVWVEGAIAAVEFRVPQGVAANIRTAGAIEGSNIDRARFPDLGHGVHASPDFPSAANRVEIDCRTAIGSLTVR